MPGTGKMCSDCIKHTAKILTCQKKVLHAIARQFHNVHRTL